MRAASRARCASSLGGVDVASFARADASRAAIASRSRLVLRGVPADSDASSRSSRCCSLEMLMVMTWS
jgi:hypothetical protein